MGDDAFSPLAPGWFEVLFGVVALLILSIVVLTVVMAVRNIRALQRAGLDPTTVQADLVARLADSDLLAPAPSLEARLAELADLRARGLISDEEHAAARAAALGT
jgi:hypothetical protein